MFKQNKKGELTTQQLVTIIILIASFVIILFLLYRLNLGQTTDKEICRNSVFDQQQSLTAGPLNCKTNYLCISGGDKCTAISQTSEASIDTSPNDVGKIKNQTFEALAKEMSDCWWEFGEGKVDYVKGAFSHNVVCAVCTISGFDDKVQKKLPSFTYSEFYNYLQTTKKTESQTYLQYLYAVNSISILPDTGYFNFNLQDTVDTSNQALRFKKHSDRQKKHCSLVPCYQMAIGASISS